MTNRRENIFELVALSGMKFKRVSLYELQRDIDLKIFVRLRLETRDIATEGLLKTEINKILKNI
jgi:hypothetical protein